MATKSWQNLVTMFFEQASTDADMPFLWRKTDGAYQSQSWAETADQVAQLSGALNDLGVEAGDRVMLVAENRPEWLVSDIAIMAAGGITTPAYVTNTPADHKHILSDSGAKGIIVSTKKLAERVLAGAAGLDGVRFLIVMDDDLPEDASIPCHKWSDVLAKSGATVDDVAATASHLKRDQTACIIYTSGTGGVPKGVMLHHGAMLHNCEGALEAITDLGVGHEVFLSFLPLSHSYEHTAGLFFPIFIAGEIYYAEGVDTLTTNMLEARPTIMTAVPRLYEVMYQKITVGVTKAGGLKKAMFDKTLELGRKKYENGSLGVIDGVLDGMLDKLVREKVRGRFGGRLKALVSGGAPLNPDIGIFFTALGLRIMQGYGQTESAPLISVNRPTSIKLHSVGPKVMNTELKIAEDGEICVQGELVMQGYWNNEEATAATIKDGWLHTGDIGHVDEDGHVVITDRKKDIIVNSGGDNIAPQRIEGILIAETEITQAMVYGDKRPHLVAVLVPDADWFKEWKSANGKTGDLAALKDDKELHSALAAATGRVNKSLSNIEKVRRFIIAAEPFSVENEQMTPTMKVRRHVVKGIYGDALEALYG